MKETESQSETKTKTSSSNCITTTSSSSSSWGTWEELLLAFAVKRHGFKDWDSVATELSLHSFKPSSSSSSPPPLPLHCMNKFRDLKRRFSLLTNHQNDVAASLTQSENEENENDVVFYDAWLDELRKRRVAELKRDLQRYDLNIVLLEKKVKKLEEERESEEKPDLEGDGSGNGEPEGDEVSPVTGENSDKDNRSFNESNSTEGEKSGEGAKSEGEPVKTGSDGPDPGREDMESGEEVAAAAQSESERKGGGDSSELRTDSAARGSSEVQSSASLTGKRMRRRRKEVSGGVELPETVEVAVKSEPLVEILEIIRACENSSLFERRLESQETDNYKNMVRQHLDLETIQSRFQKGTYSSSTLTFYRDLLLLFNNATIFFPKSSIELTTAHQLRHLVLNKIKNEIPIPNPKEDSSPPSPITIPTQTPTPTPNAIPEPKPEVERTDSLLAKQKSSAPIIVCRKRSSMSAKPSSAVFGQKDKQVSDEKKSVIDIKPPLVKPSSTNTVEDNSVIKTYSKEKPITGARSLRRGNKNLTNNVSASSKKQSTSTGSKAGSGNKVESSKTDKKKTEALPLEKKRSAADFLKRIKSGGGSSKEQKRRLSGKEDNSRKERVLRLSSDKKLVKEESSPSKRSVGRPPKRAAEASPVSAKRGKNSGEKEVAASNRPRKRARR
ncbi:myb-like protein V [Quercus lobata]|uniref:Bromo domain-containing protein n=1 Tax=Quercus lobata TaxID=97700 RepID=A0A7N2R289_QUELO|nr:myb-like protein V [Quercus lobata]